VRELVRLIDEGNRSCFDARDVAQAHLDSVREKLTELRALEQSLQAFVNTCNTACAGGPAPNCSVLEDLAQPSSSLGRAALRRKAILGDRGGRREHD
jgi:MerR family transcriptional regulator, copper efflux regulator